MVELVYVICVITSLACAVLLWRGWRHSAARLLLWSALCFGGFAVNNIVLLADTTVFSDGWDLRWLRHGSGLVGTIILLGGLIWDSGRPR